MARSTTSSGACPVDGSPLFVHSSIAWANESEVCSMVAAGSPGTVGIGSSGWGSAASAVDDGDGLDPIVPVTNDEDGDGRAMDVAAAEVGDRAADEPEQPAA